MLVSLCHLSALLPHNVGFNGFLFFLAFQNLHRNGIPVCQNIQVSLKYDEKGFLSNYQNITNQE